MHIIRTMAHKGTIKSATTSLFGMKPERGIQEFGPMKIFNFGSETVFLVGERLDGVLIITYCVIRVLMTTLVLFVCFFFLSFD
jgi:hypothetical protein